ncbi:MAG: SLC13 family permease [Candidatus Melainabacteria bacterium]|nr:SLC13 family permease [Candidatus Melainabacteria bacterium]
MDDTSAEWVPTVEPRQLERLAASLRAGSAISAEFLLLTSLSATIATLGLFLNNQAIVLAALLVVPLIRPMAGLSLSVLSADLALLTKAAITLCAGVVLSAGIACLMALVLQAFDLTPEILRRTQPNLLDLGVAFLTGVVAAYCVTKNDVLTHLAGIALAITIFPALLVIGIGIALGRPDIWTGAALLFFGNFVSAIVSGALLLLVLGYVPISKVGKGLLVSLVLLATLMIPLGLSLRELLIESNLNRTIKTVLNDKTYTFKGLKLQSVSVKRFTDPMSVTATVMSSDNIIEPETVKHIQDFLVKELGIPLTLRMRIIPVTEVSATEARMPGLSLAAVAPSTTTEPISVVPPQVQIADTSSSDKTKQSLVFCVIFLMLVSFIVGKPRYDIVALLALLTLAVFGVIPQKEVFSGFKHPAVITVAAVLVVSRALQNSGLVDVLGSSMANIKDNAALQVAILCGAVAACSAFMNDTGAVAIMMPVAIRMAQKSGKPPSYLLMPIAFASLMGGLLTMIGTPSNLIVSQYRQEHFGSAFGMFAFTPVGAGVAALGLLFLILLGWRLIPKRTSQSQENLFDIQNYIAELRIPPGNPVVGQLVKDFEDTTTAGVMILRIVRGDTQIEPRSSLEVLAEGDILMLQTDSDSLKELVNEQGFEIVGSKEIPKGLQSQDNSPEASSISEVVVMPNSQLIGSSARGINLRWSFGLNLLALARHGKTIKQRLSTARFHAGDILLLQGHRDSLQSALNSLGCLPLAERQLRLGRPRQIILAVSIFALAVVATVVDVLPVQIAFLLAATCMILFRLISLNEAYESIEWSVIVLLACIIPLGYALEATGGADIIASGLLAAARNLPPVYLLCMLLVTSILVANFVNTKAAAVLLAPVAVKVATGLDCSADPFLMSVAVGGSCVFLSPFGHQVNTLVMGPGGYRFSDYLRVGVILTALAVLAAVPLILYFWPLTAVK